MADLPFVALWRNALRDSDLDRTAKIVGFVISTYWSADGRDAFLAKTTIAAGASLGNPKRHGNRAVDLAIDRLEAAGFISVERNRGRKGYVYQAEIPNPEAGIYGGGNPGPGDRKSRLSRHEIPTSGPGESVEDAEVVSFRKKKRGRTSERPDLDYLDQAGAV